MCIGNEIGKKCVKILEHCDERAVRIKQDCEKRMDHKEGTEVERKPNKS